MQAHYYAYAHIKKQKFVFLSKLKVFNFRNITKIETEFCQGANIFVGENSSGKTSLLEAIYHLGIGRSFLTRFFNRIIQYGQEKFLIYGEIEGSSVGIERFLAGQYSIKIDKRDIFSLSELADKFPMQLINPSIHKLISEGPKTRRQFIDWGVFHVEHRDGFLPFWKKYQRIIKQRNAALKDNPNKVEVEAWNDELSNSTELITKLRREYVAKFLPIFMRLISELLNIEGVQIVFYPGWEDKKSFREVLESSINRDIALGYTYYGPHKADLIIQIKGIPAQDVLSRGQQKLFASAMSLAQAILLQELTQKKSILLIDDLPSELDRSRKKLFGEVLAGLNGQLFVTATDDAVLKRMFEDIPRKEFHVKQGNVQEI